jgi:peptide/nickel transport system permease protein
MHHDARQLLMKKSIFLTALVFTLCIVAVIVFGPFMTSYNPQDMSFHPFDAPSSKHLLGINDGGMDILTELIYGLRNTVLFGIATGFMALVIGVFLGIVAGWRGGWADHVIMRFADILLAIPAVMILILAAAFFRPSPTILSCILAVMIWPTTARACRAQTLTVKQNLHIRAARQMGAGNTYIIIRHLVPELFPLYIIGLTAKTRMAMLMEASLAFLGLFDPGRKSLGSMISYALKYYYLDIWWNWLSPPILCLSICLMAATFLAISLEKVFDPRLRETW